MFCSSEPCAKNFFGSARQPAVRGAANYTLNGHIFPEFYIANAEMMEIFL